jgi:hypothetical protein
LEDDFDLLEEDSNSVAEDFWTIRQNTMQLHTYGFSNKCIWRLK